MATIVLAHGWGFDRGIWNAVRARLDPAHRVETVDFGFFGAPRQPAVTGDVVAVGHSLGGLWWLAQAGLPWRRLLLINGFARFTEGEGCAPAVAPRVLARMCQRFAGSPAEVLAEFRRACGAAPAPAGYDADRLAAGLAWLAAWDGRARLAERAADVFALAGGNDPIVPEAMSRAAFAGLPPGHVAFAGAAGHVLPLAAPELCAQWIERAAAT